MFSLKFESLKKKLICGMNSVFFKKMFILEKKIDDRGRIVCELKKK